MIPIRACLPPSPQTKEKKNLTMFRLLQAAASETSSARRAWRLFGATTALNHTMQTSSYCSQLMSILPSPPQIILLSPPQIILPSSSKFILPSTFHRTSSAFKLWENEYLCLPQVLYREAAKDILYNSIFRLHNNMVDGCIRPNIFFADFIEILMMCTMETELITATQVPLELLFPECVSHNKEIRDHFVRNVQKIKNRMYMLALIVHPLTESLGHRIAAICGSTQLYKDFTKMNFYDLNHMRYYWLDAYNREMEEKSPKRLCFVSFPMNPALLNNSEMTYAIDRVEKMDNLRDKGRAGLLLLYRHCCEHLNNGLPVKDRSRRKETFINMHSVFGLVSLDVYDFKNRHKLKNNFELDV